MYLVHMQGAAAVEHLDALATRRGGGLEDPDGLLIRLLNHVHIYEYREIIHQ